MAKYNARDWFREDIQHDTPEHVELWRTWFAAHDINPDEVLLTHWVERRTLAQNRENKIVWLESGARDEGDGPQPITVHREVELDEPPAPFPVD